MKSLLLLLLCLFAVDSFAGKIVPNIKRDKITLNESGAAAAISDRDKSATLNLVNTDYKNDGDDEDDYNTKAINGVLYTHKDDIKAELVVLKSMTEYDDSDNDDYEVEAIFTNIGRKLNEKLYIGIDLLYSDFDDALTSTRLGLSGSYKLENQIFVGAGLDRTANSSNDLEYLATYIGIGRLSENYSSEIYLKYTPGEKNSFSYIGDTTEIAAELNYLFGKWQFTVDGSHETEKAKFSSLSVDESTVTTNIALSAEFMVNEKLFLAAAIDQTNTDYKDKEDSDYDDTRTSSELSFYVRYLHADYQLIGQIGEGNEKTEYEDSSDDDKESSRSLSFFATKFF